MIQFSVIIPVYNVEPFLEQCVKSVLSQTYNNFEVILIDDGSTDRSGDLCDELAASDERILTIHQENGGLSAARNAGIGLAKGEYVIFLDSDDFWKHDNVLEIIEKRLRKTKAQVLSFNYIKFDGVQQFESYFNVETMPEVEDSFKYLVEQDLWIACAWNKVIKRDLLKGDALRFVEGITSEDIDWCVRLALAAKKFDYLNETVVCYRQRQASITQSMNPKKITVLLDNIDRCLALMENSQKRRADLLKPFIGYQYGTVLFHLANVKEADGQKEMLKRVKKNRHLLKWSHNRKVKILDIAVSIMGFKITIMLLRLKKG